MATDQKKRTLEALERRFALAKTEVQQQQQKTTKRPREEEDQQQRQQTKEIALSVPPQDEALATPVSKKGYTPGQDSSGKSDASKNKGKKDVEEHPAYSELCQPVHKKLLSIGFKLSSNQMVDNILHELFQNGDAAVHNLSGLQNKKIDNWFQLDTFIQGCGPSSAAHMKALKSHAKRCRKHMSMKQHRKCGSFDLPQEFHKFDIFMPMHEMWKDYILKLIKNLGDIQKIAQRILSADLHGAILQVVECKVSSFTGVSGIMVRETAETFGIITLDDKFRVVPKKPSEFILRADCWKITIHGDELTSRKYGP